jgi:hypothetical protein
VVQALAGQSLTVFGDGKQTRSFCYVSDLVEGFLRPGQRSALLAPVMLSACCRRSANRGADLVMTRATPLGCILMRR